jgi:FAD dependent oxidoreductase TIGR03364
VKRSFDVAVIGAGIMGLANAWTAARKGLSVALFERHPQAQGASVRNFGMIWPIGQPAGTCRETALHSRARWLELSQAAGFWTTTCGSLHLAYREDELAVLEEFSAASTDDDSVQLLMPAQVLKKSPAANPDGLLGAMWSPHEMGINPYEAIASIPRWLHHSFDVQLNFATPVTAVDHPRLTTSDGQTWNADRIVVCSGSDFETLFPESFQQLGVTRCKLQMMRTARQPNGWKMGPFIAGGLTLQHDTTFGSCPALAVLRKRIEEETPEINRYGIHVLAAQNNSGELILGDSHEYGEDISIFDKTEIDHIILRELKRLMRPPSFDVTRRWHGIYAKPSESSHVEFDPQSGVKIVITPGGAGMTMALGLSQQIWNNWSGSSQGSG